MFQNVFEVLITAAYNYEGGEAGRVGYQPNIDEERRVKAINPNITYTNLTGMPIPFAPTHFEVRSIDVDKMFTFLWQSLE